MLSSQIRFCTAILLLSLTISAHAELVTYEFEGSLNDSIGTLPSGSTFQGSITYDTTNPELQGVGDPNFGLYALNEFELSFGAEFIRVSCCSIKIDNRSNFDQIAVQSQPALGLAGGGVLGGIDFSTGQFDLTLADLSATALSSDSLPTIGLTLSDFPFSPQLSFSDNSGLFALGTITAFDAIPPVQPDIIFESADLGSVGQSGGTIVDGRQFLGTRFELTERFDISAVGGHIGNFGGTLFAAIVPLSPSTGLPTSTDIPSVALAITYFSDEGVSTDRRLPLETTLEPGLYGLVFGGTSFADNGFMPQNNTDLPGSSYFLLDFSGQFWIDGGIPNTRFFVAGTPTDEAGLVTVWDTNTDPASSNTMTVGDSRPTFDRNLFHGIQFVPSATGNLADFTVKLIRSSATDGWTFSLHADSAGTPGLVIESFSLVDAPTLGNLVEYTVPANGTTLLTEATVYWLMAQLPDGQVGSWSSTLSGNGVRAFCNLLLGCPSWTVSTVGAGAATIRVDTGVDEDTDGDGVEDGPDLCPDTLPGNLVDANGCTADQAAGRVITEIFALIDSSVTDKARDKLSKAQDKLGDALAELDQGDVKKALKKVGGAVKELTKAGKEGADVAILIEQLVELARTQAQTAIDYAVADGGDPKEIEKALKESGKAQDELAKGKPDKAIDKYAKAWDHANKA